MSRSSALISAPSEPRHPLVVLGQADRKDRISATGLLVLGVAWLLYTRLYFVLHPRGLTFDFSAFMYLTNRPDPSCGLTRTFAWMWRGDLVRSVAVYPLGPIVFVAMVVLVAYWAAVSCTGRSIRFRLSQRVQRAAVLIVLIAVALNWASKLLWLGM
ncbi:MAG TPA: DUF2752 domain-containing protein [Candidatus Dormibacteraeota bacterium]